MIVPWTNLPITPVRVTTTEEFSAMAATSSFAAGGAGSPWHDDASGAVPERRPLRLVADGGGPATPRRVVVADADDEARAAVSRTLLARGYVVHETVDAEQALDVALSREVDALVAAVDVPGGGGFELLARVREAGRLPVILVGGDGAEVDGILGLELGADDYLPKPFSARELEVRIRSVLRRTVPAAGPPDRMQFDGLVIDGVAREVFVGGELIDLTAREFDLLAFLAAAPRRAFTREQLLRRVWRSSAEWQDPGTVTEHVRRLRHKLEPDPARPRHVVTVRGIGYRFEP